MKMHVHPRQWDMLAASCSELRDAVKGERKVMCSEHEGFMLVLVTGRVLCVLSMVALVGHSLFRSRNTMS